MLKIKELNPDRIYYYHQYNLYYGDPKDDTTWEVGEEYYFHKLTDTEKEKLKTQGFLENKHTVYYEDEHRKSHKWKIEWYDDEQGYWKRKMIPLPYNPIFFITDEERIKNRILAYADENPLMCDIHNRANVEGTRYPYSKIMSASIPKGMVHLLMDD